MRSKIPAIAQPLGMNFRNALIRKHTSHPSIALCKDKVGFKVMMQRNAIPTPKTYRVIERPSHIPQEWEFPESFVLKPACSQGGQGIMVLRKKGRRFVNTHNKTIPFADIVQHIFKVLDGHYSEPLEGDVVIVEELISKSSSLNFNNIRGLPDIRVFCVNGKAQMAMLRYPSRFSGGRANLCANALGLGIDIATGKLTNLYSKKDVQKTLKNAAGVKIPKWDKIVKVSEKVSRLCQLPVAGIDIVLDDKDRVLVLEANGHPGIEIQNVNNASLYQPFTTLEKKDENSIVTFIKDYARMLLTGN